jgi:hypothetical protein
MSGGCDAAEEVHPYVAEVMQEVGIDTSGQYPKGLRTYTARRGPLAAHERRGRVGASLRRVQTERLRGVALRGEEGLRS